MKPFAILYLKNLLVCTFGTKDELRNAVQDEGIGVLPLKWHEEAKTYVVMELSVF